MLKFEVKNRLTGNVQFVAEINCEEDDASSIKLGLSVKWAVKSGAYLRGADLSGADLRDAYLSGAPKIENIHSKVYAAASVENALEMDTWHTCDTTHCRAGWVTTLAGKAGLALEDKIGTPAAATLIYLASDPTIDRVPDFYCDNKTALSDMKRLADAEAA